MFATSPSGLLIVLRWMLFEIGYFPTKGNPTGIAFKTVAQRLSAIDEFLTRHEWLVLWWCSQTIGQMINLKWYFQIAWLDDDKFQHIKDQGRVNFRVRMAVSLEWTYRYLIDIDGGNAKKFEVGRSSPRIKKEV